jgi:3-hydroxyacyl-CoA dehydrogenase
MNRDRLLADAKETALKLAKKYKAPEPPVLKLPGPTGVAAIQLQVEGLSLQGKVTKHDQVVVKELAKVITGGDDADHIEPTSEDKLYALERQAFMRLVKTEGTLQRMEHMLTTGKPLRN